ncbi:MAG TPA: DNA primase [Haploplasma sp.]|nr:DNA primase [Haploplasma sp.]
MLSNDILQKIDDETDIVALVSEFVVLEKRGKNYMGLCPFHDEKTPSFSVSQEKNIAMCMGCKTGGRPINFYRQIKNISLVEAASELASRIGIDLKISQPKKVDKNAKLYELMEEAMRFFEINLFNSSSGAEVLKYLENRNLSVDTIKHFNLGYSSTDKDQLYQFLKDQGHSVSDMINLGLVKQSDDGSYYDLFNNRLMFPITNSFGKVVGFSGRTLNKNDNVKYVNSPETPIFKKGEIIYHLFEANIDIRRKKHVILYEGFFDVIAAYQAGFTNGVATMGTALTSNQAQLIKKSIDNVIIAFDGDNAGINATIAAIPVLTKANLLVEVLKLPNKLDPDDYIKQFGSDSYEKLLNESTFEPYQFQYEHYLEITDLTNANDISILQKNVSKMLSNAKPAILALYKNRLASDLNIDVSDINIKTSYKEPSNMSDYDGYIPPAEEPYYPSENIPFDNTNLLPKNEKKDKPLGSRYLNAEIRLIILMIRSKEWNDYLNDKLTIYEYSNKTINMIKIKIKSYYESSDSFDLESFYGVLNPVEAEYFNEHILKDEFWINQTILEESEIEQYVLLVKSTTTQRRIEYLIKEMEEKGFRGLDIANETEEYLKLKKELDLLREDLLSNG